MSRNVYNETLLNSVDYSNIGKLKRILNTWRTLTDLSVKGDGVAMSIMADLKTCFGEYPLSPTLLGREEIYLVKANLIYGISQDELAREMGISQKTVSKRIEIALQKMSRMLEGGNDE